MADSLFGGFRRRRTLLAAMLLSTSALSAAHAAPATFRFEATVFDVSSSPAATINLDVETGDKVLGEFTFQPFFLPPLDNPLVQQDAVAFQPYGASLQIGESSFHTPTSPDSLMLTAVHNVIVIDGSSTQQDWIGVSGQLIPIVPPGLPDVASAEFQIRLRGPHTLLDSAGIPGDAAILNDFEFLRSLRIRLVDTSGEQVVVRAVVGDLSVIPEPTTLALILLGVGCGQFYIRGRRLSRT